jgi:pimeloyl-ACP methyl ester carboxylesterase
MAGVRAPGFACASARRRAVDVGGGLVLRLLEWGRSDAPPLCLLHGGGAHVHWFDAVVPALIPHFHVVCLDQRGHGESDWAASAAYATEDFAADLLRVMDGLGWPRMALLGHSMGGHNAMAFAAWHGARLDRLVIVDARPALPPERLARMRERGHRPPRRHPSLAAAVAAYRLLPPETVGDPALLAHLAEAGYVERDEGWVPRFDPACYGSRRPLDLWPLLDRIPVPTLVVRGEWSPILTGDMARRMAKVIPRATLAEIPEAHHHLVLNQPRAVAGVLLDFLR